LGKSAQVVAVIELEHISLFLTPNQPRAHLRHAQYSFLGVLMVRSWRAALLSVVTVLALGYLLAGCGGSGGSSGAGGGTVGGGFGPATQLTVTTQPAGAVELVPFGTQPVVQIRDAAGVLVSNDSTTQVTAALSGGTGGATLGGTFTATAVNGVATFSGSVGQPARYRLRC
jgi:hypothetical protein